MGETFTVRVPAPRGWERFAPGALDSTVGSMIRVRDERTRQFCEATVKAAEVTEDGTACLLTVELPDDGPEWPITPPGAAYSLTDWHDIQF